MGYISEDYCSEELSGMLMEKGYIGATNTYLGKDDINVKQITIQSAMKWLREVHRIDIEVRTHYLNYLKPNDTRYYSGKILKGSEDVIHTIYAKDTYEEVCEAAIKYCLENLI